MVRRAPSAALGLVAALLLALVVALAQAAPAAAQAALASDDFNRCSLPGSAPWTLVDPVGDGAAEITGAGTADARLSLTVPEGPSHDPDVVNRSLRLLQAAPDGDFTAELKFESTPTRKYQIQGLTVQQDVGTYLRFEFYSDGSQLHAYAAAIDGGGLSTKASAAITSGSPLYLRVTRAGDAWTMAYSRDGSDYAEVVTFTQPLAVSAVGPYVGNFAGGTAPAHTAVVDYFSHQAGPPAGEDAGTPPGTADLVVTAGSGGSVERTPPAPHACGGTVSLTAVPAAGFRFESWSGALSGTANPETITLSGSTPASVGASFVAEGAGPVIADVAAAPGANAATVTWTTDVPADSRVEYGTTAAYGSGPVTSATPTTAHEVVLSGLTPSTLYHYRVTSADGAGVASSSADRTFTTAAAPGGGGSLASDDIKRCTAPGTAPWTLIDPAGDGSAETTGAGTSGALLALSVPAGASHAPDVTNGALRLLQPAPDTDLEVEVKFESVPSLRYQMQGIGVEQGPGDYLRFEFYSDGRSLRTYAAAIRDGALSPKGSTKLGTASQLWMRVTRQGDTWTQSYSTDGADWTTVATFTHAIDVTALGPYAGNFATSGAAPAYTALVDYVSHHAGAPAGEDAAASGTAPLAVTVSGEGTVQRDPPAPHACGATVALTAVPATGWRLEGWSGDVSGAEATQSITLDGSRPRSAEAAFVIESTPPQITGIAASAGETTATITFATDEPAAGRVEYGATTGYGSEAGDATLRTAHELTLSGLEPGTTYQYRVSATDAGNVTTTSTNQTFTTTAPPAPQAPIAADDFNRCTIPGSGPWRLADPRGDGTAALTGVGTGEARLALSVPGGSNHDPGAVNESLRLLQAVPDQDLAVEVGFASTPTERYQSQGIVVQQGPSDYLRFEFYSNGQSLRVYAAAVIGGQFDTHLSQTIATADDLRMRVVRVGDTWTQSISRDGGAFTETVAFTQALTVTEVGPFAGNFGSPAPAFTALIDYVADATAPIAGEDASPSGTAELAVAVEGEGTVQRSAEAPYACGSSVTLAAQPAAGSVFQGFSGALSGPETPQTLTLDGPKAVTATFVADTPPPALSAIAADPSTTGATITWSTDRPADSRVEYGPTTAYEATPAADPALVTAHTIPLAGLEPDTLYHYRVTSTDADGLAATSADLSFTTDPAPADPSGIRSDDFNGPNLNTDVWTLVNPVGDGHVALQGAGSADARLALTAPAGASHNPAGDLNRAVRVLQPSADTDLRVVAKFDSALSGGFAMQGIMVQQSPETWLRFEVYSDGSSVRAYAASIENGTLTTRANTTVAAATPRWLRVTRTGSAWTQEISSDGVTWTTTASFTQALTVTAVGPYAGNHPSGNGSAPAHTALVDYFENTAAPIAGEDQGTPSDSRPPLVHAVRATPSGTSVRLDWATDEPATRSVRYGRTTSYELGTATATGTGATHSITVNNLEPGALHHFQVVSSDAAGRTSASADVAVSTGTGVGGPVIEVFGGDTLTFGQHGLAQSFVNVQGNVADPQGVTSLAYALNGGAPRALSLGPDNRRLALPGDFNADIPVADLVDGANSVALTAIDAGGATSVHTVTVNVDKSSVWPLPYTIDWATVGRLEDAVQVVDGEWAHTAAGVRPTVVDYDRLLAVGDTEWRDYEVTVPVTVHAIDHAGGDGLPSNGPAVGIFTRWQGHSPEDATQPMWGFYPAGGYAFYRWRPDGTERFEMNAEGVVRDTSPKSFPIGTTMMFKFRVETQASGRGLYRFRAWPVGQPEPSGWDLELSGESDLPTGSVLLVAHHADVTFGDLTVAPL